MTTCDAVQQRRARPQPQGGGSEGNRRSFLDSKGIVDLAPRLVLHTERHGPHQPCQEQPERLRGRAQPGWTGTIFWIGPAEESIGPELIQVLLPRFDDSRTQFKRPACQEIVDQANLAMGGHSLRTALGEAALPQTHLNTAHWLAGEVKEAGERTRTREKPPCRGPAESEYILPTGHREPVT